MGEKREDTDKVYVEKVLTEKMRYNLEEIKEFGIWRDIKTMLRTVLIVVKNNQEE